MANATEKCGRCCGRGHIAAYNNRFGGVCFQCKGSGVVARRKPRKPKPAAAISASVEPAGLNEIPNWILGLVP